MQFSITKLFRIFVANNQYTCLSKIKKLASQTFVYGFSYILGRMLNFLLVPFYTRVFDTSTYGVVSEFYAYIPFFSIIFTFGLETGYFYFANKYENNRKLAGLSFLSLSVFSFTLTGILIAIAPWLSGVMHYARHPEYIVYSAVILLLDTLAVIPFATLRKNEKPGRFALIKLINIATNIFFNLFFLVFCPLALSKPGLAFLHPAIHTIYRPEIKIGYVFISNIIASGITLLLLVPEIRKIRFAWDPKLLKTILRYSWPLVILGFAGMINETLDRILLKYLLPLPKKEALEQLGIYSSCYKLSIFMTLAVQSFRYAAEPFFFSQMKTEDAKDTYAKVLKYFSFLTALIFLFVVVYMDIFIKILGKDFRGGEGIVPILLLANLFLGIFYTLSFWYKQAEKNIYGAYISIGGAVLTLAINFAFIPRYGFMASAWATFVCYFAMAAASFILGQRHYKVPYQTGRIIFYIVFSVALVGLSRYLKAKAPVDWDAALLIVNTLLLVAFVGVFVILEKPYKYFSFLSKDD